VGNSPQIGEI